MDCYILFLFAPLLLAILGLKLKKLLPISAECFFESKRHFGRK
jgi:hypothetical protein